MALGNTSAGLGGRPRVKVAFEILLKYRRDGLGWGLSARIYTEKTRQFISPSTVRRLVLEYEKKGRE